MCQDGTSELYLLPDALRVTISESVPYPVLNVSNSDRFVDNETPIRNVGTVTMPVTLISTFGTVSDEQNTVCQVNLSW